MRSARMMPTRTGMELQGLQLVRARPRLPRRVVGGEMRYIAMAVALVFSVGPQKWRKDMSEATTAENVATVACGSRCGVSCCSKPMYPAPCTHSNLVSCSDKGFVGPALSSTRCKQCKGRSLVAHKKLERRCMHRWHLKAANANTRRNE